MVFDDITERKQAEEALKKNVEQFKVLTESSYDIIVVFTIDGNFSYIAPSCEKFLQYKPEEMIGKSMMEFIMPYDLIRVQEAMELILGGKDLFDITIDVRKKDGSVCPLEVRGTPVYCQGTMTAIQGTARDVTDRIRAEKGDSPQGIVPEAGCNHILRIHQFALTNR
jgi:PAS domain S-box-containing protein